MDFWLSSNLQPLPSLYYVSRFEREARPRKGLRVKVKVGEAGFEPAKAVPPDLQSGPFGRSGIPPVFHPFVCLPDPRTPNCVLVVVKRREQPIFSG